MNKYEVFMYDGALCHPKNIYETRIVEAEDIDSVDVRCIKTINWNKSYYQRRIMMADTIRDIDFGSWSYFIRVQKIGDSNE